MAILFDTSVWIRHFRSPQVALIDALEDGIVLIHEAVIGELAVGRIPKPESTLKDLLRLPFAPIVPFQDLLRFLRQQRLVGRGLSWIDVHLIASALAADAELITFDMPLANAWKAIR